ncbi:hypothetical protein LTR53_003508 [Teratosphaeriaceae sp. CCFEE 6253]|nr:hypothetical protein LTR53_003508 [Teratosphaeriaceae sp. CCFEE 6253]
MPRTFDSAKDIPDLSGRVILITGGNAGIGAATVRALASHRPACIYLCSRKIAAAETLIQSVRETVPKANISPLQLDLASFDSVRQCAETFNRQSERLDILFLNAGICVTPPALSTEGYELQFGVNHVGHALLTQLLLPKMLQTRRDHPEADLRIHATSSVGGVTFLPKTGLDLGQMDKPDPFSHGLVRYGHSKLANILFARKLAQLYPDISATSSHPGTVRSEIWGKAYEDSKWLSRLLAPVVWLTGVPTDEGAKTQLWCATAAVGKGAGFVENGKFYLPIGKLSDDNVHVKDQALADELWDWTNKELLKHGGQGWPGKAE